MNHRRSLPTAIVAAGALAFAAGAIANALSTYKAGTPSHPPYVKLTIRTFGASSAVSFAGWEIKATCAHNKTHVVSGATLLGAPINNHGHFSKTTFGTTFSGTISGNNATVKIQTSGSYPPYGNCHGSHTFSARKT
jgi:hypothetical protein